MTAVTRRAIRVCTALTELRGKGGDVLDALIPFFDPLLEIMNGRVFDSSLFALGIQKLYSWRFTSDIAQQFIPRLERAGILERKLSGKDAIFVVKYIGPANDDQPTLVGVLKSVIDEFETFPPRITNLLTYKRTREELTDILIRFLVSLDAYAPAALAQEIRKLQIGADATSALSELEEGGTPFAAEDKYMAARFVQELAKTRPEFIPDLARLASVGLLTEVVEDFLRPVQAEARSDLTVIVDAPLALDYLGCSGNSMREDVRCIFDSLSQIGCKIIVLPVTCEEIQRNLRSMLSKPPPQRYGYTHNAIIKKEVMVEYVEAVASNPQKALENVGIIVRPVTLDSFPNQHPFFTKEQYEDFFSSIAWVAEVAPREHDATCLALTMRLRAGQQRNDLFRCSYVFVTRNPTFVRAARNYSVQSRMISENQEAPVIHQRELATLTWLRTGLSAADTVPRSHLLATCDRVLSLRTEVRDAVGQKIKAFTPDKIQQYELLLQDQRSVRRLADQTLNVETVITDENAEQLLEAMRLATVEEERQQHEQNRKALIARQKEKLEVERDRTATAQAMADRNAEERDRALSELQRIRNSQIQSITMIAKKTSTTARRIDQLGTVAVIIFATLLVTNFWFKWLDHYRGPSAIIGLLLGGFGAYHAIMNALGKPKMALSTFVNFSARKIFVTRINQAKLANLINFDFVKYENGNVILGKAISVEAGMGEADSLER